MPEEDLVPILLGWARDFAVVLPLASLDGCVRLDFCSVDVINGLSSSLGDLTGSACLRVTPLLESIGIVVGGLPNFLSLPNTDVDDLLVVVCDNLDPVLDPVFTLLFSFLSGLGAVTEELLEELDADLDTEDFGGTRPLVFGLVLEGS